MMTTQACAGSSVRSLDLGNTGIEIDAVIAVAAALQRNTAVTELSLENPRLTSKTVTSYNGRRFLYSSAAVSDCLCSSSTAGLTHCLHECSSVDIDLAYTVA